MCIACWTSCEQKAFAGSRNKKAQALKFMAEKCFHLTLSCRLDSILANGLLPEAKKLFGKKHATPSLGGVYYTKDPKHILPVARNFAVQGWLAKSDLAILSFWDKPEYVARIDEDDFFRVVRTEFGERAVQYIGPEIDSEQAQRVIEAYRNFHRGMRAETFQILQNEMAVFFQMAAQIFPKPLKGNFLNPIPAKEIQVEAVLRPCVGRDNGKDVVVWKLLGTEKDGAWYKKFLDLCRLEPCEIDHYYPYECALERYEFEQEEKTDQEEERLCPSF